MNRFLVCSAFLIAMSNYIVADDSTNKIREGMEHYSAARFDEASKSFAAATESLEKAKSNKAAISAFDEACALHRKGDLELARERYLKAGLSQDKDIATNAHFNLGLIGSEEARKLAGDAPEKVPADKRKEILVELSKSIDSYRHCLELQPKFAPARRNLELQRQWIKFYSDRWREADLQKRRDETNLIQFLEYLIQSEQRLKETANGFPKNTSPNSYAELKRVQDELLEEIPFVKDKIESELRPQKEEPNGSNNATNAPSNSEPSMEELERGIALLSGWADESGARMQDAGKDLMKRDASAAAINQQRAADQLDQIWDAVVPFHPLLAKEVSEQTQIAKQVTPPPPAEEGPTNTDLRLGDASETWPKLIEQQTRALRKARLLRPKAESELAQVESMPKPNAKEIANDPATVESAEMEKQVDPEAIKAGYKTAIALAPKAVQEMESTLTELGKRDRTEAFAHAEEARRILQEIQDAQPKNPEQEKSEENQEPNKDQQKENQENQKQEKDQDKKKGDSEEPKADQNKPDDKDEKDDQGKDKKAEQKQEPKVSQDRIEEALRRVREREQEKRERDRELRARAPGRVPVDKDW